MGSSAAVTKIEFHPDGSIASVSASINDHPELTDEQQKERMKSVWSAYNEQVADTKKEQETE